MPGVGGTSGRALLGVGFLAQQQYYNIFSVDSGPFIFRPPIKGLPAQPFPPNAFQSWTWQYNPNLVGRDRMLVGQQTTGLPQPVVLRPIDQTWTWSQIRMIGQD